MSPTPEHVTLPTADAVRERIAALEREANLLRRLLRLLIRMEAADAYPAARAEVCGG